MRKIFGIILGVFFLFLFLKPQTVSSDASVKLTNQNPNEISKGDDVTLTFTCDEDCFITKTQDAYEGYFLNATNGKSQDIQLPGYPPSISRVKPAKAQDRRNLVITFSTSSLDADTYNYILLFGYEGEYRTSDKTSFETWYSGSFTIKNPGTRTENGSLKIPAIGMKQSNFQARQADEQTTVYLINPEKGKHYALWFDGETGALALPSFDNDNQIKHGVIFPKRFPNNSYDYIEVPKVNMGSATAKNMCMKEATVVFNSVVGLSCDYRLTGIIVTTRVPADPGPEILSNDTGAGEQITVGGFVPGPCGIGNICKTAVGDISTDPAGFVRDIFGRVLSLAGGVAIILIIFSGYRLMASGGNPEKLQHAREQLTSAIIGLLFIIFSLSLLQIIGVDILRIPGLSK